MTEDRYSNGEELGIPDNLLASEWDEDPDVVSNAINELAAKGQVPVKRQSGR